MAWPNTTFLWLGSSRYNRVLPITTPGNTQEMQCDQNGRLLVSTTGSAPGTYYHAGAAGGLGLSGIVNPAATNFIELWGFNNDAANIYYLMLFNGTTVPANGATNFIERIRVPANGTFSFAPGTPIPNTVFGTGLVWACSTTATSLTIAATPFISLTIAWS